MDAFERVLATSQASIEEVLDNLRIREDFTSLFVGRSRELYAYGDHRHYPGISEQLSKAMSRKGAAPDAAFRGLFVEINSTFERGVKAISEAVVSSLQSKHRRYSELDEAFRNRHSVHSAKVLAKLHDGEVNGVKYDFSLLQKNLGACFVDSDPLSLNLDIFTVFIGNCTPKRLEDLFDIIGLSPPFDDELGKHAAIRKWSGNKAAREGAKSAREALEGQLELRNNIVHGPVGGYRVEASDIERAAELTLALLSAFVEKARKSIA